MLKKIALGLCLFICGIIFTYKVLVPIGDYFKEPGLPPLSNYPVISNTTHVVSYQYWEKKRHNRFNEDKAIKFVTNEIIKHTNDQRIIKIYNTMKKNQNITIQKNQGNNNIYIFTNSRDHTSELTIYSDDGEQLKEKKKIIISHPSYKVGYGLYDPNYNKIYLGVIRRNFTEGDFGGEWISGETAIDLND